MASAARSVVPTLNSRLFSGTRLGFPTNSAAVWNFTAGKRSAYRSSTDALRTARPAPSVTCQLSVRRRLALAAALTLVLDCAN